MDKDLLSTAWPPLTALVLALVYLFTTRNKTGYDEAQASFNSSVICRLDALEKENAELRLLVTSLQTENTLLRVKITELKNVIRAHEEKR